MNNVPQRPCLAIPFTILSGPDRVRLIAGEDFRYTLDGPELNAWLPQWLPMLDGRRSLAEAIAALPERHREAASQVIARLYGERVLIDGPAAAAHTPGHFAVSIEGEGTLRQIVASLLPDQQDAGERPMCILCQDRLDYEEALRLNRRCLDEGKPWLWTSSAAMSRGYVSPLFLPDAGPCLECLFAHFRRLSPVPELYEDLIEHARQGRSIAPTPIPGRALSVLAQLVLWKAEAAQEANPPAALFRLHVLETATLEIASHRVFFDPECPSCASRK